MTDIKQKVTEFMDKVVENYVGAGQEIDLTHLAEDAAFDFDLYDEVSDIPEWVFELALECSQRWEAEQPTDS